MRLFGEHRGPGSRWATELTNMERKAELAKQREIEATARDNAYIAAANELFPDVAQKPERITPVHSELQRIRDERKRDYSSPDAKEAAKLDGFVYIITHPKWPGMCKIGHSRDPEKRAGGANTWCPKRTFVLEAYYFFTNRIAAEAEVHRRLRHYRIRETEWFNLPADIAESVVASIQGWN